MSVTYANSYANKPALVNTMSVLLAYTYTQPTITVGGTTVSNQAVSGNNNNFVISFSAPISNMFLGACFTANGITFVIGGSVDGTTGALNSIFNSSSTTFLVDVNVSSVSGVPTFNSITDVAIGGIYPANSTTVQDIQQLFLSGPSQIRYSFVIASLVMAIDNDTPFYINGRGRLLCTIDDGSVFIDTARFSYSSSAVSALNQCTYVNFANKIKNAGIQSNLSTSNTVTVRDTSAKDVTLTIGSAGGNNINENHNTRPEILLALLSNGGVGNAIRYSSSTFSINQYFAIRFGTVSEYNIGTIRVNVPTLITITP